MTRSPAGTIPTLDGWRAISILMVTVLHTAMNIWSDDHPEANSIVRLGALGVDIFFGISGLLITKLLIVEFERKGRINLAAFYVRRLFRVLIPCYCFIAVVLAFKLYDSRSELLSCLFFYRNYLNNDFNAIYTAHLWSLAVEEHFYLLWPPILVLVTVKRGREVAMWMAVAIALWRIAVDQNFPALASVGFAQFRTDYRLDSLLWGAVIAFILHKSGGILRARLTPAVWTGILTAFIVCVVLYSRLTKIWMPMLIPLLLAGTLTHPEWAFSRLLDSRPMVWLGRLSYSLYLWQILFLAPDSHSPHWWQHAPVNVVLAIALAALSHQWLEQPLRRIGKRVSDRITNHAGVELPRRPREPGTGSHSRQPELSASSPRPLA